MKTPRRPPRPRFKFDEMKIPVGSTLLFSEGNATVTVCSSRTVQLNGMEMSLTGATSKLLKGFNGGGHAVRYWTYNGRTILDIYNDTYH